MIRAALAHEDMGVADLAKDRVPALGNFMAIVFASATANGWLHEAVASNLSGPRHGLAAKGTNIYQAHLKHI